MIKSENLKVGDIVYIVENHTYMALFDVKPLVHKVRIIKKESTHRFSFPYAWAERVEDNTKKHLISDLIYDIIPVEVYESPLYKAIYEEDE